MIPEIGWWGHHLRYTGKWKAWMTLRDILKQNLELSDSTKGMTEKSQKRYLDFSFITERIVENGKSQGKQEE